MPVVVTLVVLLFTAAVQTSDDAQARYLLHCRGCHLADGTGVPPDVPTLVDEIGRLVATPVGREYVVRVPGVSQAGLDDAGLAVVLNWILETFIAETLPANFQPYSASEIAEARGKVLADPLKYRRMLRLDGSQVPR